MENSEFYSILDRWGPWIEFFDESTQHPYFYNEKTKETVWELSQETKEIYIREKEEKLKKIEKENQKKIEKEENKREESKFLKIHFKLYLSYYFIIKNLKKFSENVKKPVDVAIAFSLKNQITSSPNSISIKVTFPRKVS